MNTTEEINKQIKIHGSERDALNVALARISELEGKLAALHDVYTFKDCPNCGGVVNEGWRCLECGYDPSD